jgi:hypothetical protein
MINDFKNQTPETIFRFLSHLGQEADVYSCQSDNLCPTLANDCAYLYIKNHELVIVLIDYVMKRTREIADYDFDDPDAESKFQDVSTPELAHIDVCRTSPVWKLFQGTLSMRDYINLNISEPLKAHAVLITTSDIVNYEDLDIAACSRREGIGMTIFHRSYSFYDQWQSFKLPVNTDMFLPGANYLQIYKHELSLLDYKKEEQEFQDLFNQMLETESDDEDHPDTDDVDDDIDFDTYGFDDDGDDDDDDDVPSPFKPSFDEGALEARIAACKSAEERSRLIVLRAKLAVKYAL